MQSELLPEDVIPSTTVLTEIAYGEEISLEFIGEAEKIRLTPSRENLEKYSAGNEFADVAGVLKIRYPADFLKPDLVLYDTPGIDDLLEKRADLSFEALRFCDGALVLVSAVAPLGLNERQFISEYLEGRKDPKIAIVVSYLDQLNPKDQLKQLKNINDIVKRLCPDAEIWSALPDLPAELCSVSGIEAMRQRIQAWGHNPQNEAQKDDRLKRELLNFFDLLLKTEESKKQALIQTLGKQQSEQQKAQRQLRQEGEAWGDLRNDFLDASLANVTKLQELAEKACKAVLETGDPSLGSRAQFRQITEMLAKSAQESFNEDLAKLLGAIQDRYGLSPQFGKGLEFIATDINEPLYPHLSAHNESIRLFLDLMDQHVGEIILWLPLPVIGRKIASELARRFLIAARWKYDDPEERQLAFQKMLNSASSELREMLRESYAQVAEKVLNLRDEWLATQKTRLAIEENGPNINQEIESCSEKIKVLQKLRDRIASRTE